MNSQLRTVIDYAKDMQKSAAEVRHLLAKFPVSSPQVANKFNDLGKFLI